MASNIFVDSDILLDLFLVRKPFFTYTQNLLALAEQNKVKLFTSSIITNNLFYFIAKYENKQIAKQSLRILINVCKVLPVDEDIIKLALDSEFNDFEDALQYFTATGFNCEKIVTRNLKHYRLSAIPVLTAEQFLEIL